MSEPVFPTFVPSLYQYLLQTILCSKVDIALHLFVGSTMSAIRLALAVVGYAKANRRQVVGIAPRLGAYNHVPPYATILSRVNPRSILNLARLVEVQSQLARQHVAGIVANKDSTPRSVERSLNEALTAYSIRSKPRLEGQSLVVEVEVHSRIIQASSLVNVDIKSILSLHLQRSLHACVREYCGRRIALVRLAILGNDRADTCERSNLIFILLSVVVARNPVSSMVASHGKLCVLLLDYEIVEALLLWKFITQSHTIIIHAEADGDVAL